jgi:hypothetical protein
MLVEMPVPFLPRENTTAFGNPCCAQATAETFGTWRRESIDDLAERIQRYDILCPEKPLF